jgi:hypothetical protein
MAIFHRELRAAAPFIFKITLCTDPTENPVSHCCGCMFTATLSGNRLPISPCADGIENSFPSIVASIHVYRAVAWQRVDQIYIYFK